MMDVERHREALRNLIDLSRQRQEGGQRIQARTEELKEAAAGRYHRATRRLKARREAHDLRLQKTHDTHVAAQREAAQSLARALKASLVEARERAADKHDAAVEAIKKELDHAVWVAQSVFDAERARLAQHYEETEKQTEAYVAALEEMRKQAQTLVRRFKQSQLVHTPVQQPPESGNEASPSQGSGGASDAGAKASEALTRHYQTVERQLAALRGLALPRWFEGVQPYIIGLILLGAAAAGLLWLEHWRPTVVFAGQMLGVVALLGVIGTSLSILVKSQVRAAYLPLHHAAAAAREAADHRVTDLALYCKDKQRERKAHRNEQIEAAKTKYEPRITQIRRQKDQALEKLDADHTRQVEAMTRERDDRAQAFEAQSQAKRAAVEQRSTHCLELAGQRRERQEHHAAQQALEEQAGLDQRWREGWSRLEGLAQKARAYSEERFSPWADARWQDWTPADTRNVEGERGSSAIQFGTLRIDPGYFLGDGEPVLAGGSQEQRVPVQDTSAKADTPADTPTRSPIILPAMIGMPKRGSVLWQFKRRGRTQAIDNLQLVMARLLTAIAPGQVRLTIIDPVGLGQNFAGFMHLVDYEEDLVGARIWTGADHIEQRLTDLTDHMENVIQKYLRNEFETIDDYNARAGELAEPYRFLVITDFPVNFNEEAAAKLKSIVTSGPRCGVYTLIAADATQAFPTGLEMADLEQHSINLVYEENAHGVFASADMSAKADTPVSRFVLKDGVFDDFPLALDEPPDEETLTRLLRLVGQGAKDSNRVEVSFESITPSGEQVWTGDSSRSLRVPIGRSGATRLQEMVLGKGVAQHVLIAGKTGSGKSTLLHVMVTNLALWFAPDQVEFYLIDFKKGVEFKTYAVHQLPHARAVAIESDREFGLSVLQRLDGEITRRGELFREQGVQDLSAFREAEPDVVMPRTLLMIDEFQEFFSEDDKLAQDAGLLLDRLVRQGRAFGIHVLLGSQTLGGTSNLPRSTIGQMAVRIALQCSDADSQLILSDENNAARLLSRPGEAIYNDASGLIEGNSPFQVCWLPDKERDQYLDRIREQSDEHALACVPPLIVFEGNAPAHIERNQPLRALIQTPHTPRPTSHASHAPVVWLGEAVAIKEPTAAVFRRQSGGNLLIVGQQDETATAMMVGALTALAAQTFTKGSENGGANVSPASLELDKADETPAPPIYGRFYVFDGTPADVTHAGALEQAASLLAPDSRIVAWREVELVMAELAGEVRHRNDANLTDAPAIFVLVHGLQRYRMLRRQEDAFGLSSFGSDDDEKPGRPDQQFVELLRDGPPVGVHVLTWCDTPTTLERTLDRQMLREFDHRVLFQMSALDSSNLIDSPAASQLGYYRALFHNEEQGVLEKFRPYGMPEPKWLEEAAARISQRVAAVNAPDPAPSGRR